MTHPPPRPTPLVTIRLATSGDADALARILADQLRESYPGHVGSTAAELRRDVLGPSTSGRPRQAVLVAETAAGALVGFVAWDVIYDMHWASYGAQVADFYVAPAHRGRGLALELVAHLAAAVHETGGAFIRGGAYDRASTRRFYARIAVVMASGETHLGGRALRHLAALAGRPARTILGALPPVEWNHEP